MFEHEFRTQKVLHLTFEPFAVDRRLPRNHVTICSVLAGAVVRAHRDRAPARLAGEPACASRCRISAAGYGSKLYIKLEALALALSMLARAPREGRAHHGGAVLPRSPAIPSTFRIKSGVDKNGRIVARKCEVCWNGGAYADIGPRVTQKSGFTAAGPYDIDNVWINSYALYTNLTPAGALRGFGMPQLVWAYESHTDMIARALEDGSGRVPPEEPAARGPPAADRPDAEGRARSRRCWTSVPSGWSGRSRSTSGTGVVRARARASRSRSRR